LYLSQHFKITSMIDVSDGLVQDLTHLAAASGVSCCLDLDKVPVSKAALKLSRANRSKALKRACCDGEDFELLFTVSAAQKEELCKKWKRRFPDVPLHFIGKAVVRGKKRIRYYLNGKETAVFSAASGYRHFTS
ncbi:MAG: hypothetical protein KDD04_09625, partial [Sinomicrobium sp.]|nr:hypothetical protein [Sinomicrobium sp.]